VLFKDKEFKESGARYVPYINAQFLLPVILVIVGFVINYFSPTFYSDLITITPAEGESMLSAFSHKIPMIFFVVISAILVFFSLTKKLSLIPILGLLSCLYLMTELGVTNWIRFGVWLLVGMVIYFMYGYSNSHLNRQGEAAAEA